jgi:hypothetical protein
MNLADRVRSHCQDISQNLQHLTINYKTIASYAQTLDWAAPLTESTEPSSAAADISPSPAAADIEQQRLLVLALDTINFGSGWHDVVTKRPGLSGARSMAASLIDFANNTGGLTAHVMTELEVDSCVQIFGQDATNTEAVELVSHFSRALNQLGAFVNTHESATAIIDSADRSAVQFAEILSTMELFNDVGYYKRAQIAAADLARESLASFDDLADLTAFADNLVPHVLAVDGVITLQSSLRNRISKGELLVPRGRAEAELRAVAVQVVELMCLHRPDLRAMDIDRILWERGGEPLYKSQRRPRCRSVYY